MAKARQHFVCIDNDGYPASLTTQKTYVALHDPAAEKHDLLRIIDESGDDYLYPKILFRKIELPQETETDLISLLRDVTSWDGYISALHKCDDYWRACSFQQFGYTFSVLGDEWSWVATITQGRDITKRKDWENLSIAEKRMLAGKQTNGSTGAWELLGNMGANGKTVATLYHDPEARMKARNALQGVLNAADEVEFLRAAGRAIFEIEQIEYFGPAIATRLITLARPDRAISLNRGSAPQLSRLTRIQANERNYQTLLRWLYGQPWYRTVEPKDAFEKNIWSMRAALIDCFVYTRI